MSYYAIDFGTSNSLLTYVSSEGDIRPINLEKNGKPILKSLLFTPQQNKWYFGEEAIEQYMEHDGEGRFFRSLKKFLPEPNYKGTEVHNKKMKIDALIATFLREMRERANKTVGKNIEKVILGRPALYSLTPSEDKLAEDRMKEACLLAGFKEVHFCPEPLAAGLDYDKNNKDEKIVLVADFGGGTSDFTLMKLDANQYSQENILGLSGIFKAGDAIDGEMMRKFISRHFGSEFEYTTPFGDNILRLPKKFLKKICSPAHITHLREKDAWSFLQEIQKHSIDDNSRRQLDQLFALVEYQLGFPIFQQIEKSKIELSKGVSDYHLFKFDYSEISIEEKIYPDKYREKMLPVVEIILDNMMEVFNQAGLKPSQVDQVCLTGGTAQFTLIKERLKEIFGEEKIVEHNIYSSVVGGLAQYGLNLLP